MKPSPGPISTGSFPRPPTFNSWSTRLASTQQTCFKSLAPFGSPNLRLTNSFKTPIYNSAVNRNSEGRLPFSHALVDLERTQVIIQASPILVVHASLERRPPVLLSSRKRHLISSNFPKDSTLVCSWHNHCLVNIDLGKTLQQRL